MFFAQMLTRSTLCRSFASLTRPVLRDPNRPALPLSAYFRFAESYRKEKNLKGGVQTMKEIGAAWKTLPEEKKKPFLASYQVDKDKYAAAFQKYKDSGALDAWKRDPLRPKAPLTAFFRYMDEFRTSNNVKGLAATAVIKEGAIAWKVADLAKKNTLETAYQKDKAVYTKALEEYKASGKDVTWKKKVGIWDAEQKEFLKKQQEKDKKRQLAEKEKQKKIALAAKKKDEALKLKAKQQALRLRDKEKAKRLGKKTLALSVKEKERAKLAKEKERAKLAKEKERAKLAKEKERAKLAKEKERAKQGKVKAAVVSKASKLGTTLSDAAKKQRARIVAAIDKEKKTLDKLAMQLKQQTVAQRKKLADMKAKVNDAKGTATKKVFAKKPSTTTRSTSARK
eukprot:GEMP01034877.1.p1 GENE.GEMP01034877.1~~GEMP01034877.1.p1  ORF type:complete len:396 (+),score=142.62 GEMP01034877.1:176-1363(+)